MKDAWKLLLVLAAALIVLGLGLGNLRTVYAEGRDCGTAFDTRYVSPPAGCEAALSDARVLPWILMGLGVAAAVGGVTVRPSKEASTVS